MTRPERRCLSRQRAVAARVLREPDARAARAAMDRAFFGWRVAAASRRSCSRSCSSRSLRRDQPRVGAARRDPLKIAAIGLVGTLAGCARSLALVALPSALSSAVVGPRARGARRRPAVRPRRRLLPRGPVDSAAAFGPEPVADGRPADGRARARLRRLAARRRRPARLRDLHRRHGPDPDDAVARPGLSLPSPRA